MAGLTVEGAVELQMTTPLILQDALSNKLAAQTLQHLTMRRFALCYATLRPRGKPDSPPIARRLAPVAVSLD